ncbi:hypothetical protein GCM10010156_23190 [Planobispora rosea]|uniref:Uncharacterized protein n=1 Tax=Planobispora rosea TaxID=35762 RepID=A0A8J3WCW6_PLARO|nr:hypothetical protein [Planobispora rosea]GGS63538.1 hypothetical protein GCM10010156_23190 [Planobispora rosea]GIH84483.1 hypothetical protein Pro02_28910 [Planobispora rosea]
MRLPRTASGWTIAVFGLLAFLLGGLGLISPDTVLGMLGFEVVQNRAPGDYTLVYMAASSMAAVNMGIYYMLAAAVDFRPFFLWTVPFRLLTFTVFTMLVVTGAAPGKFLGVGLWEGAGALITGAALWWEARRGGRPGPRPSAAVLDSPRP